MTLTTTATPTQDAFLADTWIPCLLTIRLFFLSKLGPKGQNMGHTPVTEKRPISGQNAKVLTVTTAESSVFCPEQRTNRIKFRRIDRNCYRRLINDRGSPGDSVLSLSLGFTSLHLQICIQDCRQWRRATRSASVREKTKTNTKTKTRSASVREKRDDTCLFWGAACRLVAGPWLPV